MDSIRDALLQTSAGRKIVVEVKARHDAVAQRRQQVIDLIQAGFPGRSDILAHARTVAKTAELIRTGGPEYVELTAALTYAPVDRRKALDRLGLLKR